MGNSLREELKSAAEGLALSNAQKHILAHRLARKLKTKAHGTISVAELLEMIEVATGDMTAGVEMMVVSEESYRGNRAFG